METNSKQKKLFLKMLMLKLVPEILTYIKFLITI